MEETHGEGLRIAVNHLAFGSEQVKARRLDLALGETSDWHARNIDYLTIVIEPGLLAREIEDGTIEDSDPQLLALNHSPAHCPQRVSNLGSTKCKNTLI